MKLKSVGGALRTRPALVYLFVASVPLLVSAVTLFRAPAGEPLAGLPAMIVTAPLSFVFVVLGQAVAGTLSDAGYHALVIVSCVAAAVANAAAIGLAATAVRAARAAQLNPSAAERERVAPAVAPTRPVRQNWPPQTP